MIHVIVTDRIIEINGFSGVPDQQKDIVDYTVYKLAQFFAASLEGVTGQSEAVLKCEDHMFLLDRCRLNDQSRVLEASFLHILAIMADVYDGYFEMVSTDPEDSRPPVLEMRISKAAFTMKGHDDILKLFRGLAAVEGADYSTIRFEDGTGVFLVHGMACCPEYGKMDQEGCIDGLPVGYVKDTGSCFILVDDQDRPLSESRSDKGINGLNSSLNLFSGGTD